MVTDFAKILLASMQKNNVECDHIYDTIQQITLGLIGGKHTQFVVLKCNKCGDMSGFPNDNLILAIKNGTEDTKEKLRQLGFKL